MVSSDFAHSVIILFFFLAQLSGNFLKIAFQKRAQFFLCLSLIFESYPFLCWLKHYQYRGFGNVLCFCCLKKRKKAKNNNSWNFWIWVFGPKMVFRDSSFFFQKKNSLLKPPFCSVLGCALFGPSCQKQEILDTHQKKKPLTDNWKPHFLVFLVFLVFYSSCSFFLLFCWRV